MFGKKIELFLVNGTFEGTVLAELSNWSGKAIKVLRDDKDIERDDIKDIGVYLLFCGDETDGVYVGESENVSLRLKQHKQDYNAGKEDFFWTTALAFTGRDLNKAKIRFIENELIRQANEAKRYNILTKTSYSKTKMKESEVSEMMEFIENIKVLVNTMGYKVFVKNVISTSKDDINDVYYITRNETDSKMIVTSEGFVLLAGSKIRNCCAPSFSEHSPNEFAKRKKMIEEGFVGTDYITLKDIPFSSPSSASNFVLGACSNGKIEWKELNGITLGQKAI